VDRTRDPARKSNSLFSLIFIAWGICLAHFDPKLLRILGEGESVGVWILLIVFVALLNIFWLYGIYHCAFAIYRLFPRVPPDAPKKACRSRVAILYTTRNDFSERAALSCLRQSYRHFHLFLLDDSTEPACRSAVDRFHLAHADKTTVVRRPDRKGFKAGNLNHALRAAAAPYEYFAVIDADEVIPQDFLERMLPYFSTSEDIGFVQAHHEMNPRQPSAFALDLGPGIAFHWDVYQPPRNRHGFVVFYGHGGVIRRDVWAMAGGFPEIVSEDLAFSTRIRQLGFRGLFVREVTCYEDFPETYRQFRKRHEKWVKGACEYLHREFLPFLLCRHIGISEKLDVTLSCFSLFLPAIFLAFLFVANAALPLVLGEQRPLVIDFMGWRFHLMSAYFLEPRFRQLWHLDFYFITLLGMFAPIICYCGSLIRRPRETARLLLKSCVPYVSLIVISTLSVLSYLCTRKAEFLTTGDRREEEGTRQHRHVSAGNTSNHAFAYRAEWLLGLILVYCSISTLNFALLTIASALILSPLLERFGWENRTVSFLASAPLIFVLFAFSGMGAGLIGLQGFSMNLLALHF
jgi:cellulose synthase/poly-beta-1,6-N-acetylglucosamine synthase-like glycosyltransferase